MNKISIDTSNKINEPRKAVQEKVWENPVEKPERAKPKDAPRRDNIDVSKRAAEVRTLSERAAKLPDVRETLVSHFKASISAGRYNPSTSDISAALLGEEL